MRLSFLNRKNDGRDNRKVLKTIKSLLFFDFLAIPNGFQTINHNEATSIEGKLMQTEEKMARNEHKDLQFVYQQLMGTFIN